MLSGKVVLITNATHFVGPTAAKILREEGATVICHDTEFVNAQIKADFAEGREGIEFVEASAPKDVVTEALGLHGHIDAVVCNDAFPAIRAKIEDAEMGDLRGAIDALITWPYEMIGAAIPQMKARNAGKIVLITSAAPIRGLANYSMYAVTRGAMNALTKSLSLELLANEDAMAKMLKNIPLNRLGKPEEVASLIAFLASDKCNFVTGHTIPISGGWA